jgi:acylglycerol lipase
MSMETREWNWATFDGLDIHSKEWVPSGTPKAAVCVLHGVGEHIGRYQPDGEALAQAGYVLAGFDQRGFGRSGGRRGHTPSLDAYFKDIDRFFEEVSRRHPDLPRVLYGMSMGGVLVLAYTPARRPNLAGVIAAAPGLRTALEEQKVKVLLARLLGQVTPTLTMKSGVDPQEISRDPQVVEAYLSDPLDHFLVTASWGRSMLQAVNMVFASASSFPLPLLLLHGTKDAIAYPRGSQEFAGLAPKDKVSLKMWDGMKHELHTDPDKAEVFRVMIQWIDAQTRRKN